VTSLIAWSRAAGAWCARSQWSVTWKEKAIAQNNGRNEGRGFAGMDAEKQREIASEGGRAAHESGNAHEWDAR
jgi:hypothetical protein